MATRRKQATRKASRPRGTAADTSAKRRRPAGARWSAAVMRRSDAMDLEAGVFKKRTARQIALSLQRSVEASTRRKSPPFRSAMSMLTFEINRGGRNLSAERRRVLDQAKDELRKLYHRQPAK
ncbi:MAG: DUF3175 domain-containing protein [Sinobacteraceae bacterium]|nr:DUF3175 domain-containing protein [Nevskiaceae bacterium]